MAFGNLSGDPDEVRRNPGKGMDLSDLPGALPIPIGAVVLETGEGVPVFTAVAGLVAVEELEGAAFVGEGTERAGEVGDGGFAGLRFLTMAGGSEAFGGFLQVLGFLGAPETHATPVRDGDKVDLIGLDTGRGLELVFEGGEKAVADGVLRGAGFAFGRDGSGRVGGVGSGDALAFRRDRAAGSGAGGGDLEFGSGCFHYGDIVARAQAGFGVDFCK